ncbi:MAG: TlpA disulfide reductase family protein [Chitinophagaceae bacterium]
MKPLSLFLLVILAFTETGYCQSVLQNGFYRATLTRQDSNMVVFNLQVDDINGKKRLQILNAEEKILVSDVSIKNDSVNFRMPAFESEFKSTIQSDGSLKGVWINRTASTTQYWPFAAVPGQNWRFAENQGKATNDINGKWEVSFTRPNNTIRPAIASFKQTGNKLTGTFLTPSGDYRYLQGIVTGDSLYLSAFDGSNVYLFSAKLENQHTITGGLFRSGIAGKEKWEAVRNEKATLPSHAPSLKEGSSRLNFTFKDINGRMVSINDERFKNKVVIIQLMGSWCPNCLDETKFLSEYYNRNRSRGVEVIALAYEYSTDFERSQKSLRRFQQLYNVQYPMLITGVTASDTMKTEKTLPQLTPIRAFPTTLFLDKKGYVRKLESSYYGPVTGEFHEAFKKEFFETVSGLIGEK